MTKAIIPAAALGQHIAILGKTGSGKTSTGKLLVEQVVGDGDARVCILDTVKSDWWGLTSSADGKKPGLPFHILGGPHGHVPIHASAGKAIAEIVASGALRHSIIDMADFEAGGAQRFFVDFAPALLRNMRGVLYLVIEEAHELAPKERSGFDKENMSVHYAKKLATAGRSKGIRLVVLTQRTQSLHNALLGSCETMIVHRLTAPADQEPVLKWLKANASGGVIEMIAAQISSLKTGAGWVCSGEAKIFERIEFPRIKTYDNSATPTHDAHQHEVKTAPVDQDNLRAIIGTAVKEAEENDPKRLRAEVTRLKGELAKKPVTVVTPASPSKDGIANVRAQALREGYAAGLRAVQPLAERLATLSNAVGDTVEGFQQDLKRLISAAPKAAPQAPAVTGKAPSARQGTAQPAAFAAGLSRPQQRILDGLAWLQGLGIERADRVRAAMLADQSPRSSGYEKNVSTLKTAGLIDYPSAGELALTPSGAAIATPQDIPATDEALQEAIRRHVSGPQWKIIQVLIEVYPKALDREQLAERAEASALSSGFEKNVSTLRSLGFIDYPTTGMVAAQPVLFLGERS